MSMYPATPHLVLLNDDGKKSEYSWGLRQVRDFVPAGSQNFGLLDDTEWPTAEWGIAWFIKIKIKRWGIALIQFRCLVFFFWIVHRVAPRCIAARYPSYYPMLQGLLTTLCMASSAYRSIMGSQLQTCIMHHNFRLARVGNIKCTSPSWEICTNSAQPWCVWNIMHMWAKDAWSVTLKYGASSCPVLQPGSLLWFCSCISYKM